MLAHILGLSSADFKSHGQFLPFLFYVNGPPRTQALSHLLTWFRILFFFLWFRSILTFPFLAYAIVGS